MLLKLFSSPFQKTTILAKWKFTVMIYRQRFVNKYLIGWNFCHGIFFCEKKISFSCENSIYRAKSSFLYVWIWLLEECFGQDFGESLGELHGDYLQGFKAFFKLN